MHPHRTGMKPWRWNYMRTVAGLILLAAASGCSAPFFKGKEKSDKEATVTEFVESTQLIGDMAIPFGLRSLKVEAVAVVNGLDGTGSNPPPSPQRDRLLGEIQTHAIDQPSAFLASPNTAMVFIKGLIPPGARKGDRFDIDVAVPPRGDTSSLRGGWLMPARLREMQVLGNALHSGSEAGLATGPVIVESIFHDDEGGVYLKKGRVLGGGKCLIDRPMGLIISNEHTSVQTSTLIGAAVNARFSSYDRGLKKGVATPKEDDYIEVQLHPTYKHNLNRYMAVIRSIAIRESASDRLDRLEQLKRQLIEPISAPRAALHLEAIGREAAPILKEGVRSVDPQVRFYSAEALAYLDQPEAAEALAEAAANQPKFRWRALVALAAMDHLSAYDSLVDLLDNPSVETRYGAFYALRLRNPGDPLVRGEVLGDSLALHRISSSADLVVHFSRTKRPEVVIFGIESPISRPAFLYAGKNIIIKGTEDGRLKVTRFSAGKDTRTEYCAADVESMVRTIIHVGGDYADVFEGLQNAQASGDLKARIAIDTRTDGRRPSRDDASAGTTDDNAEPTDDETADPAESPNSRVARDGGVIHDVDIIPEPKAKRGLFSRMLNPFGD